MKTLTVLCIFFQIYTSLAAPVTLIWDKNIEPEVIGYNMERAIGETDFQWYGFVSQTNEAKMFCADLDDVTVYRFQVRAISNTGFESGPSNIVVVNGSIIPPPPLPVSSMKFSFQIAEDGVNFREVNSYTTNASRAFTRTVITPVP